MKALPYRIGMALVAGAWTAGVALAQSTDQQSLSVVKNRMPAGDVVYVTDTKGATIEGRLVAVTDDVVRCDERQRLGDVVREAVAYADGVRMHDCVVVVPEDE